MIKKIIMKNFVQIAQTASQNKHIKLSGVRLVKTDGTFYNLGNLSTDVGGLATFQNGTVKTSVSSPNVGRGFLQRNKEEDGLQVDCTEVFFTQQTIPSDFNIIITLNQANHIDYVNMVLKQSYANAESLIASLTLDFLDEYDNVVYSKKVIQNSKVLTGKRQQEPIFTMPRSILYCSGESLYKTYNKNTSEWVSLSNKIPSQNDYITNGFNLEDVPVNKWVEIKNKNNKLKVLNFGANIYKVKSTLNTSNRIIEKSAIPVGQVVVGKADYVLTGDVVSFLVEDKFEKEQGDDFMLYTVSFDSGSTWRTYKNGSWNIFKDVFDKEEFKKIGMSKSEFNSIVKSDINSMAKNNSIKIGYFLEQGRYSNSITSSINKFSYETNIGGGTPKFKALSLYALNTVAQIDVEFSGGKVTGIVRDADNTNVQYRILLNGEQIHPIDSKFTALAESPLAINYRIPQSKIQFGKDNIIRVEFQDAWGITDYWEQKFFGEYFGLIMKDEDGNELSDPNGNPLKRLDFGDIISGQITLGKKVTVTNTFGYDLKNVTIVTRYRYDNDRALIQYSLKDEPFVGNESITFNSLANNETVEVYVRVATGYDAQPISLANFDMVVSGEKA